MKKPFNHRRQSVNQEEYKDFTKKWLTNHEKNPCLNNLFIINGWQAIYKENLWYAELLSEEVNTFAYDSRGQGSSPKHGRLDAIDNAIDAHHLITNELEVIQKLVNEKNCSMGNTILQGNCIGTMTIATLFAGKFDLASRVQGVLLLSPVSTFNLPLYLKITYFLPKWFATFSINHIAPRVTRMIADGEKSEFSRNSAMERLYRLDHDAALQQVKSIFWKENVEKYWKYVNVPALILVGRHDPLVKYEDSIHPYENLPYPIWMELDAPDHLILESNMELIKKIIPEFISDPWAFYEKHKHLKPKMNNI